MSVRTVIPTSASLEPGVQREGPDATRVGMLCFLLTEAVFFATLVLTYLAYLGARSAAGPTPAEALKLPVVVVSTACLLSSSAVIHRAMEALRRDRIRRFRVLWGATLGLGVAFLTGTALEWTDLVTRAGLTPRTNLFGSTYYTLVGFHSLHVTLGIIALASILRSVGRHPDSDRGWLPVQMVSWYWHFVDAVWVVVFGVVYVIGR